MRDFVFWILLIIAFCLTMCAAHFVVFKMQYAEGLLFSLLAFAVWMLSDAVGIDDEL